MKKLYFTAVIMMALLVPQLSNGQNDPTKLARVVSTYQIFNFYDNGLIKEIKRLDGTLEQSFVYDTNNNLTQRDYYINGTANSNTYGYDSNNRLNLIGDIPLVYNIDHNSLTYYSPRYHDVPTPDDEDDFLTSIEWRLNNDGCPISRTDRLRSYLYNDWESYTYGCEFTAGNLNAMYVDDGDRRTLWEHVLVQNPLKTAFQYVCRATPLFASVNGLAGSFLSADFYSTFLVSNQRYYDEDPESDEFYYELNAIGLPVKQYRRFYYFGQYEMTRLEATFYYQGDALP